MNKAVVLLGLLTGIFLQRILSGREKRQTGKPDPLQFSVRTGEPLGIQSPSRSIADSQY